MLRKYEFMFILEAGEKTAVENTKNEIKEIMKNFDGSVLREEDYGNRKLAYQIKKKDTGYYYLLHVEIDGEKLKDIDWEVKHKDTILKYITIKLKEKHPPVPSSLSEHVDAEESSYRDDRRHRRNRNPHDYREYNKKDNSTNTNSSSKENNETESSSKEETVESTEKV